MQQPAVVAAIQIGVARELAIGAGIAKSDAVIGSNEGKRDKM